MGIFSDYNIDIDEVKESNYDIADGTYRFTIAEAEVIDGTQNKPDTTFFVIDYQLEDENGDAAGQKRAWYTMAEDGRTDTRRVTVSMSILKSELLKLGLKGSQLADFDGSEIVGKTGVLTLKTGPSKNNKPGFQNIRNLVVDEDDEPEEKPVKKAAPKAKPEKKKVTATAPVADSDEDEDDNPFGN